MIKSRLKLLLVCSVFSTSLFAGGEGSMSSVSPWSLVASVGFTNLENMYKNDGQTAVERLAIAARVWTGRTAELGLELGVQNGNIVRPAISEEAQIALGGSPLHSTLKPMLDLLATAKAPFGSTPLFAVFKGGIAYRHLQITDRDSVPDLTKIAGELQAGLGYQIVSRASLALLYQGVYGGSPNFYVNTTNQTGAFSNIPIQQGVLLSLTLTA